MAKKSKRPFSASLGDMPLLLPTGHSAVRQRMDQWFERQGLRPQVVGEFEDSALLAAFGRSGMGAFPASRWSREELLKDSGLQLLGDSPELVEHFFMISAERRHPLVQRLLPKTRDS